MGKFKNLFKKSSSVKQTNKLARSGSEKGLNVTSISTALKSHSAPIIPVEVNIHLSVFIERALAVHHSKHLLNVYCIVRVENQQVRTSTVSDIDKGADVTWNEGFTFDVTTQNAEITIEAWGRTGSRSGKLLGYATLPVSEFRGAVQLHSDRSHTGKIQVRVDAVEDVPRPKVDDFELISVIGKGTFGKVMLCRKRDTGRFYAMKVIMKTRVYDLNAVQHTLTERNILKSISHPFIVNLKYSFQTSDRLHLIMDYINGGELFYHMTHTDFFSKERAQFYAGEIVLAIGFLHENGIIYRDLKPENLLLDMSGHICITDFGLSKQGLRVGDKTDTHCGSPEYLAPEMVRYESYSHSVDWWALGTLLYEMMAGWPPFFSEDLDEMNRRILEEEVSFPEHFDAATRDIITKFLEKNPAKRLSDAAEIKRHSFFSSIDWQKLAKRQLEPPFRPHLTRETDLKYVAVEFRREEPTYSPELGSPLSNSQQDAFKDFSYVAPFSGNSPSMLQNRPETAYTRRKRLSFASHSADSGSGSPISAFPRTKGGVFECEE